MKEELLRKAFEAMAHAYAPYSHFSVGACLLLNDNTMILGANIENASFGATNCAERSAVFAAYSQGYHKEDIKALAIVSAAGTLSAPCGICRQVLAELIPMDTPIYLSNHHEQRTTSMKELLPLPFGRSDLHGG